jgi:hypothetical protein
VSKKCYIGKTTKTLDERRKNHLYDTQYCVNGRRKWTRFLRALNKEPQLFDWMVLESDFPIENINAREIFWIDYYRSRQELYNMTIGGDGGDIIGSMPNSAEIRKRAISLSITARKGIKQRHTLEVWKQLYGEQEGSRLYDEYRIKLIAAGKSTKIRTEEHNRKIGSALKGRKWTEQDYYARMFKPVITQELINRVLAMSRKNCSVALISSELNISPYYIRKIIKGVITCQSQ